MASFMYRDEDDQWTVDKVAAREVWEQHRAELMAAAAERGLIPWAGARVRRMLGKGELVRGSPHRWHAHGSAEQSRPSDRAKRAMTLCDVVGDYWIAARAYSTASSMPNPLP